MKLDLILARINPDPTQYKKYDAELVPNDQLRVRVSVSDKEVVCKDPMTVTPAGLAEICAQCASAIQMSNARREDSLADALDTIRLRQQQK